MNTSAQKNTAARANESAQMPPTPIDSFSLTRHQKDLSESLMASKKLADMAP